MVNTEISDCIACVLSPILRGGCVCGPSPLIISCPHSKPPTVTATFARSKILLSMLTLSIVLIIASVTFTIWDIHSAETFNKKVLLVTEVMFSLLTTIIDISSLLKINQKLTELNGLSAIVNQRYYYGLGILIDSKGTKRFQWLSYIMICISYVAIINFSLYTFLQETKTNLILTTLKAFALALVTLSQSMLFNQYCASILLYRLLYKKCFNQVKIVLKQNLSKLEENNPQTSETRRTLKRLSLEQNLKRLRLFCMSLNVNNRQLNLFMQPSMLFGFIVGGVMLVFNCYTVVLIHSKVLEADPLIEMRSFASALSLIIFLYIVDYAHNVVSNYFCLFYLCSLVNRFH